VSLKGASPEDFTRLTGANPESFDLQLKALENLVEAGVDCFLAVMANFSSPGKTERLRQRLKAIRPDFASFEEEELILYPFVQENLRKGAFLTPNSELRTRFNYLLEKTHASDSPQYKQRCCSNALTIRMKVIGDTYPVIGSSKRFSSLLRTILPGHFLRHAFFAFLTNR